MHIYTCIITHNVHVIIIKPILPISLSLSLSFRSIYIYKQSVFTSVRKSELHPVQFHSPSLSLSLSLLDKIHSKGLPLLAPSLLHCSYTHQTHRERDHLDTTYHLMSIHKYMYNTSVCVCVCVYVLTNWPLFFSVTATKENKQSNQQIRRPLSKERARLLLGISWRTTKTKCGRSNRCTLARQELGEEVRSDDIEYNSAWFTFKEDKERHKRG